MRARGFQLLFAVILMMLWGCTTSNEVPVTPAGSPVPDLTDTCEVKESTTTLWGYFDLIFDIDNKKIEAVPNRSVEYATNVVVFLNSSPLGVTVAFNGTTPGSGYVDIDMDITIKHPLQLEKFNGYDVRGVFIGNGSGTLSYNTDLLYPVTGTDQILLNADGYTRYWNPSEFTSSGFQGYTHGNLASAGYTASATLNGYKYFGEGLIPDGPLWNYLGGPGDDVGYFIAGSSNTRNYQIRFSMPAPGIKYGYAVLADWSGGQPDDHPSHAHEAIGERFNDFSWLYYHDETNNGGVLSGEILVHDWHSELTGGVMEDYTIILESTVLENPYVFDATDMTPTASSGNQHTYSFDIPADNVEAVDGNELWILIQYNGLDYTSGFGVPNLAGTDPVIAAFRHPLTVEEINPYITVTSPNGGESWEVGTDQEITWVSSGCPGNVTIEYSKDGFQTDINTIATGELNDGSYMWNDIPNDISDTVRVRISSEYLPLISDTSDADFSIFGKYIKVLTPNGGENWAAGSAQEITWESGGFSGTVDIEYSMDAFDEDINTIVLDETNDGSYTWDPLPLVAGPTAMVRITSTSDPATFDLSDGLFAMIAPGFADAWQHNNESFHGTAVCFDAARNIYCTGSIYSATEGGLYLRSYDMFGQSMWSKACRHTDTTGMQPTNMLINTSSEIVIAGGFRGTVDFDPLNPGGEHTSVSGEYGYNAMVVKYNPALPAEYVDSVAWAFGTIQGLALDMDGNIYLSGAFEGTVDFDPDPIDTHDITSNELDAFILKLDTDLDFQWVVTWGGAGNQMCGEITYDQLADCLFVSGAFDGTDVDFDPGAGTDPHTSAGLFDAFVSKFQSDGTWLDTVTWGGTEEDAATVITCSQLGGVFVGWQFYGTVDADPDPVSELILTSSSSSAIGLSGFTFDLLYNGSGMLEGDGNDDISDIVISGYTGLVYAVGDTDSSSFELNPGIGSDVRTCVSDTLWVSAFDTSFNGIWGHVVDNGGNDTVYIGAASSLEGELAITGEISGEIELAPIDAPCIEDSFIYTPVSTPDAYLIKYLSNGCWE